MSRLIRLFCACCVLALVAVPGQLAAGPSAKATAADAAPKIVGPVVSAPVAPASFDGDVRDLPTVAVDYLADREVNPRRGAPAEPIPPGPSGPWRDPLWEEHPYAATPLTGAVLGAPILNVDGGKTGATPHDPVGDVGPDHFVQAMNSAFSVYDKSGVKIAGPTALNSLFTPLGGVCAAGIGDPIVLYDPFADRWIIAQIGGGSTWECIAVSKTPSPTGAYWLYQLDVGSFPDFPKLSVWPDAYYMTASFGNTALAAAFDRGKMLIGDPTAVVKFTTAGLSGLGFNILMPADVDGSVPPPSGSPGYFYRQHDGNYFGGVDRLELWSFHVDWTTTTNSTFTGPAAIPLSAFDAGLCGFLSIACVPQPGSSVKLDPLNEIAQWRFVYRNFGGHETLLGNFTVDVNGADGHGIRWFELRRTGGGPWTLYQEGTHAPQNGGAFKHRWLGSIAMDKLGNIALGYAISASSSVFPGLRYGGRLAGDPPSTLPQGEGILKAGETFTNSNRWGDYFALVVDPSDDCTFWFTGDYLKTAVGRQTRIGTFKFTNCTNQPVCGNRVTEPPETCDDGNTTGGDGCAAGCTLELICGNAVIQPPETCDPPGLFHDCPASCSCCTPHAAPGCDNTLCRAIVCSHDSSCCDTSWHAGCVATASLVPVCQDCCAAAVPSNCCAAHAGVGCGDASCQSAICAADPSCCSAEWDADCAAAAAQRSECQDDCCTAYQCRGDCTYCGDGQIDPTEDCEPPGPLPPASDCCAAQLDPGCSNGLCQAQVCALDPQCCSVAWDAACAAAAETLGCCSAPVCRSSVCCYDSDDDGACDTADSCPLTPNVQGTSNCCAPQGGPGCDSAGCQADVCATNPSCCSDSWDVLCAAQATANSTCRDGCGGAAFAESLLAPDKTSFGWLAPAHVAWARGDLANVALYQEDEFGLTSFATSIAAPEVPAPGVTLWWLARPDCPAGSWTSGGAAECGATTTCPAGPRDANLP